MSATDSRVSPRRRRAETRAATLLTALAFAAGCTDAVSYLALGRVFTANMTGNTVLLGIAIVGGEGAAAAHSACALGGFCAGVAIGALVIGRAGARRLWPPRTTGALAAEAMALVLLAVAAAVAGRQGSALYWLIVLSGMAMGLQSAAVRRVGVASVATTYITGTLTGLISEAVGGRRWARAAGERCVQQRLLLPAAVWATYLAAALAGAAATRAWSTQAIWIPVAAVSAVTGIASRSAR